MAREGLTGSRIRERRTVAGLRQAELARLIGISASYLNLIEHNRRRIGGKLLLDIAAALGVTPALLTDGAEAALIATLREAADDANLDASEIARADEFAGRFPGWSEVLATTHRRIAGLERTIETLNDRLAHDPQLAASLHELLSTAAAIRSTASILADEEDLSKEWLHRFHRNINEDSRRLAESSKSLVGYLDASQDGEDTASSPLEEVEAFLSAHAYYFAGIEAGTDTPQQVIEDTPLLRSVAAGKIARGVLEQLDEDARALPMQDLRAAMDAGMSEPLQLAKELSVPIPLILRRLAACPQIESGLVVCDRSGSLLFRKAISGFAIPRIGDCCPLWPLFAALSQPGQVVRARVSQPGRTSVEFDCYAVTEPKAPPDYNTAPLLHATMLIVPVIGKTGAMSQPVQIVGPTCRVCARHICPARREPSILSEGF
ncbi:MAG: helix-turn-helix domain-containing protein [Sulfitobacter sp.]